jgi:hypothetical protein
MCLASSGIMEKEGKHDSAFNDNFERITSCKNCRFVENDKFSGGQKLQTNDTSDH